MHQSAGLFCLERVKGIEPSSSAWKAEVLPLNYTRKMAVPTGIEPAISCVTGRHVNRYTTGPIMYLLKNGGGRGIRTPARYDPPVGFQDRSLQPDLGIPPKLLCCLSDNIK